MAKEPARRVQGELLDPNDGGAPVESLAIGLTRAEVDQQIATAKRYPRAISAVQKRVLELATMDQETAEEMIYARPQAGEVIRGPSIRFAELLLQSWGNARCASRTVHVDQTFVEAEGIYHDLETNTATVQRVRRRIIKKDGKTRYAEDQILVTANAAGAIARRNAILGGIPKPIWRNAILEVEKLLKGDAKTLVQRRKAMLEYLRGLGVEPKRVFETLGIAGEPDISLDHLLTLHGFAGAIKNQEATIDELFPAPQANAGAPQKSDLRAGLGGGGDGAKEGSEGFNKQHVDDHTAHATGGDAAQAEGAGQAESGEANAEIRQPDSETSTGAEDVNRSTGEVGGEEEAPDEEVEEGHAAPGEVYMMSGDEIGEDEKTPTYKDGKPFSRVGEKGWKNLKIYAEHAPEIAADPEPEPAGDGPAAEEEPAIRANPEDRREPGAEPEAEEEEEGPAEAEAEAGPEPEPEPQQFSEFFTTLRATETWMPIKQALVKLYGSDEWNEADPQVQRDLRIVVWEYVHGLVEAGKDKLDVAADPTAFRLWIETSSDAEAISGTFTFMKTQPIWAKLKDTQQESLAKVVDGRLAKLK